MKVCVALLGALLTVAVLAQEEPHIEGFTAQRDGAKLLVSFELVGGIDDEMLERIDSGLPTELEYTLRLHRPRVWWFDKTYQRTTLRVVAKYDAVTQEYQVNYRHDDRIIDSRVVGDHAALVQAMTLIHSVPLFDLEEELPPRTLVMVRAELGSRHILLLFPNRISTPWARLRLADLEPTITP